VCDDIIKRLDWQGPVYRVAAINKQGTERLTQDIMLYIEQGREEAQQAEGE
jgi:GTP-binding protein